MGLCAIAVITPSSSSKCSLTTLALLIAWAVTWTTLHLTTIRASAASVTTVRSPGARCSSITPASPTAEAIVDAGVRTVAVSVDGITAETYESIRVGSRWHRLMECLRLLDEAKRKRFARHPRLRVIFTWMRSNFGELPGLPALAAGWGARELDVRFVTETLGLKKVA